jgi:hypothetical protein
MVVRTGCNSLDCAFLNRHSKSTGPTGTGLEAKGPFPGNLAPETARVIGTFGLVLCRKRTVPWNNGLNSAA